MWFCCSIQSGNKHLNFLEFNNFAGEGRLWFKGVVIYERMAKCRSSSPSMAFVRHFLIVSTKHSTCPLDCAFVGDVTLCCIPQVFMKSWNSCDVNYVPPSETIHLGIPISLKIPLRCLITLIEWRLCSFLTMGNWLKQSTVRR